MDLLTKIVNEKLPCYFISPHLDDAILSAGSLISYLSDKTKVDILTVFTEASPKPYTRFCRKFMKICGYSDADIFFEDRRKEDETVCKKVNVNYKHLGLIDVAWRKKQNPSQIEKFLGRLLPEFIHLYPLGRNFMSGRIVEEDKLMISDIKKVFQSFTFHVSSFKQSVVFCPLAIGNHVDHVIVINICKQLFGANLIFWTDYPYINRGNTAEGFIKKRELKSFTWGKNLEKKRELILGYKTQIPALFPKSLPDMIPETFYAKI